MEDSHDRLLRRCAAHGQHPKERVFYEGQNVLVQNGLLLNEAKIMRVTRRRCTEGPLGLYFVHYFGWQTAWDEWVPADRVWLRNAEGLQLARRLARRIESCEEDYVGRKRRRGRQEADRFVDFGSQSSFVSGFPPGVKEELLAGLEAVENDVFDTPGGAPTVNDLLFEYVRTSSIPQVSCVQIAVVACAHVVLSGSDRGAKTCY